MPKYLPKMDNRQFRQTNDVVTKPLVGISMTIITLIEDTTGFDLITQSCDMNECVTPMSMIIIRETPLMKHIPQIKLSDFQTLEPLRENKFPLACATLGAFRDFWHWVLMCPCPPQLK